MKKNIINKLATLVLAIVLFGCSADDKVVDIVLDEVDTASPFLRILNQTGSNLDIFNTSSEHSWILEYQLIPNDPSLELLQGVEFTVEFIDNNDEDGVDNSAGPVAFGSLSPADFSTEGPFGNMQTSFGYTLQEAMDALGLNASQLSGGDTFLVDWDMSLTDGRVIGSEDVSGDVAAVGGYYSSQYQLVASLVCEFDEPDFFTGTYQIQQLTGSDPFYSTETFGTQTVEITGSGTSREFVFLYYPVQFAFEQTLSLNFVCDRIEISGTSVSGTLGCGAGTLTQANTPDIPSLFDTTFTDDSEIILYIQDHDDDAGCGTDAYQIQLRLTKL